MQNDDQTRHALERLAARLGGGEGDAANLVNLAVLVANADGVIDEQEMETLARMLQSALGAQVRGDFVKHFVFSAVRDIRTQGLDACARSLGQWLAGIGAADEGLEAALAVAYASNGLSRVERAVIDSVARAAGAAADRVDALSAKFRAGASGQA